MRWATSILLATASNPIIDHPSFRGAASGGDLPLTPLFEPVGLTAEQQDVVWCVSLSTSASRSLPEGPVARTVLA